MYCDLVLQAKKAISLVFFCLCATTSQSEPTETNLDLNVISAITDAEFTLTPGPEIPFVTDWRSVSLTDRWPIERYQTSREGWYRVSVHLDDVPLEPFGVYLRRFNLYVKVYLNGSLIASGGQFTEPITRNWNYPLYVEPPSLLWKQGANELHVRLISYRGYGYLSPIFVGPPSLLRSEYEIALLTQVQIAKYLLPITIILAAFILTIWLRRREDTAYFWFAVAVAAWSIYIANMFIQQLIMPTRVWEWIAHFSVELWVVSLFAFSYRFLELRLGKIGWALSFFLLATGVTYSLGDLYFLRKSVTIFHAISLIIGFGLVLRLAVHWVKTRALGVVPVMSGLFILLASGLHDWLFQTGVTGVTGRLSLHLYYYCAPIVFVFIAWHLTSKYSRALDDLSDLNVNLEQRVADAESELTARFEQIRSMEQREAVLQERERIAQEIHDAVGGRFSSAIMMTDLIGGETPSPSRIETLRTLLSDGLIEVRQLVTAMVGDISNSSDLIHYVADKCKASLQAVDVELHTTFNLAAASWRISDNEALNIVRIFQESCNNIIKHASATSASLNVSDINNELSICLRDQGVGLSESQSNAVNARENHHRQIINSGNGHLHPSEAKTFGLSGMRRRSEEIGASLSVTNHPEGGCMITLILTRDSSGSEEN